MDYYKIEQEVLRLQNEIWDKREFLFPNGVSALQVLEPYAIAEVLGVEYLELANLSQQAFPFQGRNFETGGLLDRQARRIAVSSNKPITFIRHTAGHEAGHWVLHSDLVMHRDVPLDGSEFGHIRPPKEKEADYFSACFYMPARLVKDAFKEYFQTDIPFVFHETHAYHLCPQRADFLLHAEPNSLERELSLASCRSFGGNYFNSLAETFRVSKMAMALRIRELGLVDWP